MNLVSIIIPAYNCANTIEECLKSIFTQTWTNWEVIIINDGSTDDSKQIIKNIIGKDDRFLLINQSNYGSPIAKNIGLSHSKGDFIQFLDADDFLSPDKLENQVIYLQQNKYDLIWCSTIKFSKHKSIRIDKEELYHISNPIDFLLCLNGLDGRIGMVQPNAYMLSRILLNNSGSWNELLKDSPDDDSEFFSRVLINAHRVFYDNKSINYYREPTSQSLSNQFSIRAAIGAIKAVELKFKNIFNQKISTELVDLYAYHLSLLAYRYGRYHKETIMSIQVILNDINRSFDKRVGGKRFQFLASCLGFNRALNVIRFINYFNY